MKNLIPGTISFQKTLYFSLLILCLLLSACNKDDDTHLIPNPIPVKEKGAIRLVGQPTNQVVSQTIGTAGGSIISGDSRIKVEFPAGALSSDQEVTIQAIINTNPSGLGLAYRLTPHDVQFQKPVQISFSYEEEDISNSLAEFLGIAFQDKEGVWQAVGGSQINTTTKTVTVKTTHFSDWSFFQSLTIEPQSTTLSPGESLTLKVYRFLPDADLLAPLVPEGESSPIIDKTEIDAKHIVKWDLGGPGKLTPTGNSATYTAPQQLAGPTEVAVSAQIKSKYNNLWLLISNIMIAPEGITFRLNSGKWINANVPWAGIAEGIIMISGAPLENNQPKGMVYIAWDSQISAVNLDWDLELPQFRYVENDYVQYYHVYPTGNTVVPSSGKLNVTKSGAVGEYITGTFSLHEAGKQDISVLPKNPWVGTVAIEGFFRVKRSF
jgi:hypothetical protein